MGKWCTYALFAICRENFDLFSAFLQLAALDWNLSSYKLLYVTSVSLLKIKIFFLHRYQDDNDDDF